MYVCVRERERERERERMVMTAAYLSLNQLLRWNSVSNFETTPRDDVRGRSTSQPVPNLRFNGLPRGIDPGTGASVGEHSIPTPTPLHSRKT